MYSVQVKIMTFYFRKIAFKMPFSGFSNLESTLFLPILEASHGSSAAFKPQFTGLKELNHGFLRAKPMV